MYDDLAKCDAERQANQNRDELSVRAASWGLTRQQLFIHLFGLGEFFEVAQAKLPYGSAPDAG